MVAALGLLGMALIAALITDVDLGTLPLIAAMTASGFCYGVMMPSRDMIVRDITPRGSFGKVFGFVTTGFNIGGIIAPLIFGAIMDHASPRLVFIGVAVFSLIAVGNGCNFAQARGLTEWVMPDGPLGLVKSAELPHVRAFQPSEQPVVSTVFSLVGG